MQRKPIWVRCPTCQQSNKYLMTELDWYTKLWLACDCGGPLFPITYALEGSTDE